MTVEGLGDPGPASRDGHSRLRLAGIQIRSRADTMGATAGLHGVTCSPGKTLKGGSRNEYFRRFRLSHSSLQFKKVGDFWSARIGQNYRALATKDGEDFLWVWLGTHDDYEGMIR